MEDLQLKKQNFDRAKSVIRDFSNNLPHTPQLEKFEVNTFFGMMSKNVTGKDMNEFVVKIQKLFLESNKTSINIIKEFKEIYNVFEALDNQYLKYFKLSIENLKIVNEKTSNAQKEIDRTIQALKLTIEKLSEYKAESTKNINLLEDKIEKIENNIYSKLIQLQRIEEIKSSIESYKHFDDIDNIWEDVQKHNKDLNNFSNELNLLKIKNDELETKFYEATKSLERRFDNYEKITNNKLLISYVISGVALLLIIVQFVLSNK